MATPLTNSQPGLTEPHVLVAHRLMSWTVKACLHRPLLLPPGVQLSALEAKDRFYVGLVVSGDF